MNAVIYRRVSSKEQIERTSLESREAACRDNARFKGFDVLKVFVEQGESVNPKFYGLGQPRHSGVRTVVTTGRALHAASGNKVFLSGCILASYCIGHGTYRRGTSGILRDLEKDVQGRSRDRRRSALRLTAHRALCSTRKTSAVGEGVSHAA
jgi:hypothetical protein